MPIEIIVALIAATPPTIIGLLGIIISLRNQTIALRTHDDLGVVKKQTDGLIEASKATSKAEGVTQGHREAVENAAAAETAKQ